MIANKLHQGDYYINKQVPSLMDLSIDIISEHFSLYPSLPNLKIQSIIDKIIKKTSLNWPITITAPHIHHESYWKRACECRWKNIRPMAHGGSWKQTYIETHLEEMLTKHPGEDFHDLIQVIMATRSYIMNLNIEELPSHLDLRVLFKNIPCITKLRVSYGAKRLGSEYDRALFGMRMNDAATLAKCIKNAQCLSFLALPCNLIDDELSKMLARGLLFNKTILELDLSHNRIADHGARRLAKYLFHTEILTVLDLSDNLIQYEGSRCLAQALRNNTSLKSLSLKHNRLDDKAGAKLLNDLQKNSSVISLNLSSNLLSIQFCERLSELLSTEYSLRELDISCNLLVEAHAEDSIKEEMVEAVQVLHDTLERHCKLTKLDVRQNNLPTPLEKHLVELVLQHALDLRGIPLFKDKTPVPSEQAHSRPLSKDSQQRTDDS